jgi:hypothetical protein
VVVRSYARGELRAMRSVTLTAPNLFGTVQVTRLAPLGSFAREKDLVVEFDDSEVLSRLEEKQLELDQIDEQIKKAQADLAIRNNQDQVDLLNAKYGVRRAELEVRRNELLAAIDAKKNVLNLEEAKKRLSQLESDIKSRQEQALAQLAVMQEKKNKGILELDRERRRLSQVKTALADQRAGGGEAESRQLHVRRHASARHPRRRSGAARNSGGGHSRPERAGSDRARGRAGSRKFARGPGSF